MTDERGRAILVTVLFLLDTNLPDFGVYSVSLVN
jgi:hypothetical protein